MSDNNLHFKESVLQSPIYRAGDSARLVFEKYGIKHAAKLSSNENPLPTSPAVVEAIQKAAANLNRYPSINDEEFYADLAAYIGRGTTTAQFATGNGGCDVLFMIANAFLTAEDEAIICPPTFPVYEWSIRRIGATLVGAPLNDGDYSYNVERILAAVTPKTKLLYLCSPNNPTGSILTQADLETLMAELPEHVLVVSDEVYHHFNTSADYANSYQYLHDGRNIVIVHSFSKVFGLAGMRLGYAIARPEIASYLNRMRLPFHMSTLTFAGGRAGLQDRDHIEQTIELTIAERQKMLDELQTIDHLTVWPTQANFLLFKPERDAKQIAEQLQQRGSIVRELSGFYLPGFLRVSVGQPDENSQFLQHLKEVLDHS